MNLNQVIIRPLTTEKIHAGSNQFGLLVNPKANKSQVTAAVNSIYGVEVVSVRMITQKPIKIRTGRKRLPGTSSPSKKAIITLESGQNLTFTKVKE